jgi:hypothetical protein
MFPLVYPLIVLKLLITDQRRSRVPGHASTGQPVRGLNRTMDRTAEAHPPID